MSPFISYEAFETGNIPYDAPLFLTTERPVIEAVGFTGSSSGAESEAGEISFSGTLFDSLSASSSVDFAGSLLEVSGSLPSSSLLSLGEADASSFSSAASLFSIFLLSSSASDISVSSV